MSSSIPSYASASGLDYRSAQFFISASNLEQCPDDHGQEVAFMGRSNAGKSSAINTLTGQRGLARASKTPGRTQLLNFFALAEATYLVDLPGFGYAKVPPKVKAQWQRQLDRYLRERRSLRGLVLLMDIRHPFMEADLVMINWALQAGMPLHVLLTKADKLKRGAARNTLLAAETRLRSLSPDISSQLFSSLKGEGVKTLAQRLDSWLLRPHADPADADTPPEQPSADDSEAL